MSLRSGAFVLAVLRGAEGAPTRVEAEGGRRPSGDGDGRAVRGE